MLLSFVRHGIEWGRFAGSISRFAMPCYCVAIVYPPLGEIKPGARCNPVFYLTSVTGICDRWITLVATEPRMRLPTVPMPRVPMMILSQR